MLFVMGRRLQCFVDEYLAVTGVDLDQKVLFQNFKLSQVCRVGSDRKS